jgi:hypothetical protein
MSVSTEVSLRDHPHRVAAATVHLSDDLALLLLLFLLLLLLLLLLV